MFTFAFLATGLFIASLVEQGLLTTKTYFYLNDPRHSFFTILVIVLLVMGTFSSLYLNTERLSGIVLYERGINTTDENLAERSIIRSVSLAPHNDLYYRILSDFYLNKFLILANKSSGSSESVKTQLQALFDNARNTADHILQNIDATNPDNWTTLGRVYETGLSLQNTDAYQYAKMAYGEAKRLDPVNPGRVLAFARLEFTNKNISGARDYLKQALDLKPDYTDALYFGAHIDFSQGNNDDGIAKLNSVIDFHQNEIGVVTNTAKVAYNEGMYATAVKYFERARAMNPYSVDLAYFLALAYQKSGDTDSANKLISSIEKAFPDNKNIKNALDAIHPQVQAQAEPQIKSQVVPVVDNSKKKTHK